MAFVTKALKRLQQVRIKAYMNVFALTAQVMTLCVFLFLLFLTFFFAAGNLYEVSFNSFEPDAATDQRYVTVGSLRVSRKDRNRFVLTGYLVSHQNFGNENACTVEIRGLNGKGPVLLGAKMQLCDFYSSDFEVIKTLIEANNMPPQGTCPVPKGNYTFSEYELQEKDLPMIMMKDKYVVSVRIVSPEGKLLFGYKVKLTVS